MEAKRKRRRFQFRLRTLMIGVSVLAGLRGYVGRQAEIVRERSALLQQIVGLGGCYNNISSKCFPVDMRAVYIAAVQPQ